jgi:hypothetical protein
MDNMNAYLVAALTVGVPAIGFGLAMLMLPDYVAGKIEDGISAIKKSPWFRDPAHPKRAKWARMTLELIEDEVPEPGTGKAFYDALGAKVASLHRLLPGSTEKWARLLEKVGDKADTTMDEELLRLAADSKKDGQDQNPGKAV